MSRNRPQIRKGRTVERDKLSLDSLQSLSIRGPLDGLGLNRFESPAKANIFNERCDLCAIFRDGGLRSPSGQAADHRFQTIEVVSDPFATWLFNTERNK